MILITGAARGIGKYLFDEFRRDAFPLPVFGTYYKTIPANRFGMVMVDVTAPSQTEDWIRLINEQNPLKDLVLINCAGINYTSFAHKADADKWAEVINVNLVGTFNAIHAVLPIMRKQKYGRIINLSSVVAQTFIPGASAYAASKAGLWGMTRSIAAENAALGITINNLNLGYFDIGMIDEVLPDFKEIIKSKIPGGKFGDPEEIYRAVNFLIDAEYINGTSIDVNGGMF